MKSGKTIPRPNAAIPRVGPGQHRVRSRARAAAPGAGDSQTGLSSEERRHMIEVASYFRAERRGFAGGTPEQDWLEAEAEVDRMLAQSAQR